MDYKDIYSKYKKFLGPAVAVLFIVIATVVAILSPKSQLGCNQYKSQGIAQDWIIQNSLTYRFDGSNIALKGSKRLDCGTCYEFTFTFESGHAGYGDRTGQTLDVVPTTHTVVAQTEKCEIKAVTNDNRYDEIRGMLLVR